MMIDYPSAGAVKVASSFGIFCLAVYENKSEYHAWARFPKGYHKDREREINRTLA